MKISVLLAVLAMLGTLSGCATTETTETAAASAAKPSGSADPKREARGPSGPAGSGRGMGTQTQTGSGAPELKRSVYYEFDKYDVKPEYRALIESHARWLKANPSARLTIEGNADEQGSREYNLALGQRRAESVTKMLTLMGAKPDQIEAISYGEERPRVSGHDEKAWSKNRRSDFAPR